MIHSPAMGKVACTIDEIDPSLIGLRHICANLRRDDAREVFALMPTDSWQDLAAAHWLAHVNSRTAYLKMFRSGDMDAPGSGAPIAMMIVVKTTPHVGEAGLFATDEFPLIAYALTRHLKNKVIPALYERGLNRVEVRALADQQANRRWIEYLGARPEALLPCLGKNAECFAQYAWTQEPVGAASYQSRKEP